MASSFSQRSLAQSLLVRGFPHMRALLVSVHAWHGFGSNTAPWAALADPVIQSAPPRRASASLARRSQSHGWRPSRSPRDSQASCPRPWPKWGATFSSAAPTTQCSTGFRAGKAACWTTWCATAPSVAFCISGAPSPYALASLHSFPLLPLSLCSTPLLSLSPALSLSLDLSLSLSLPLSLSLSPAAPHASPSPLRPSLLLSLHLLSRLSPTSPLPLDASLHLSVHLY